MTHHHRDGQGGGQPQQQQQPAAYPQQPAAYPQQVGAYPQQVGAYPQQVGAYPQQAGAYPQQAGAYPQQAGAYPQQVGAYPQQAATYPQQAGAYPQQAGAYLQQAGAYPQQAGAYSQQAGAYPQQAGAYPKHDRPKSRLLVVLGLGLSLFVVFAVVVGVGLFAWRSGWFGRSTDTSRVLLLERELDANPTTDTTIDAAGRGRVTFPRGTIQKKAHLTVSEVTNLPVPPAAQLGRVLDVSLGAEHAFEIPVRIELPFEPSQVTGRFLGQPKMMALWFDPSRRMWDYVPYTVDATRSVLIVDTPHLSMFSAVSPAPIAITPTARIEYTMPPYAGAFADAATAENILRGSLAEAGEAGWNASMEWFGIGQAFATVGEGAARVCEYSRVSTVLGRINDVAGNLGVAFALVQFTVDMSKPDNEVRAVGNALKAIGMDALSRWGTSAIKVAGVGVFALDYSLGKFANTAWSQRNDMWRRVFDCYYKNHARSSAIWLTRLKTVTAASSSPDAVNAAIQAEIEAYAAEIWNNEEEQAMCQFDVGGTNVGSGGGLNEKLKRDLSAAYAKQLYSDLRPEFGQLSRFIASQQQKHTQQLLEDIRGRFNRATTLHVVLKSKSAEQVLEGFTVTFPVTREPEKWQGATDKQGVFDMKVTSLGYMLYGSPTEVMVTFPAVPGAQPETRKQKFKYVPGRTVIEIALDGVAGTYEGELNGTHSGPGIDGVVAMKGPIKLVVDDSGNVNATLSMPLKFTSGRGVTKISTESTASLAGKLEGATLTASGTVNTKLSSVTKLPVGKDHTYSTNSSGPIRIEGALVNPDRIDGKVKGSGGSRDVPFSATRR